MKSNRLKVRILLSEALLVSKIYYLIGQCKTQTTDRVKFRPGIYNGYNILACTMLEL